MTSYAAAFRTYAWDDDIAEIAWRFFRACPSARQVVLVDETRGSIEIPEYEKISHTEDTSSFGLPNVPEGDSLWYNGDYGIYFLKRALPEFDYYLLSESDLAVNLSCEPIIAEMARRKIDALVHEMRPSTPDWYWHRSSAAVYAHPLRAFLYFMCLSRRAVHVLLAARQRLARKFLQGQLGAWPICESFLPTVLRWTPGIRFADVGEFASVENLHHRPRISLSDPRASAPGSLVHSVLGTERFIATLLAENDPNDYFRPGTDLHDGLSREPFESVVGPLRRALLERGDHFGLSRLDRASALRGMVVEPGPESSDGSG